MGVACRFTTSISRGESTGFGRTIADGARAQTARGHDDDGDLPQRRVALMLVPEVPSAHHGHHEVEEDQARLQAGEERSEGLLAVRRRHDLKAFVLEHERQDVAYVLVSTTRTVGRACFASSKRVATSEVLA